MMRNVLTLLMMLPTLAAAAQEPAETVIAVSTAVSPWFYVQTFEPTMERLRAELPRRRFRTVEMAPEALREAAASGRIDFFMAPSGSFAFIEEASGARHIATHHGNRAADPAKSVGSLFIVRAGDSRYRTLEDLRGSTVAASDPGSFDGWLIALGEIAKLRGDPEKFFGRALFTGYGLPDITSLVQGHLADAGILKACDFEQMAASGIIDPAAFRVIGLRKQKDIPCRVSTGLYPDVVFASLPRASSELVREVSVALLTMPSTPEGNRWGFASDFSGVRGLYRTLRAGPYAYLRDTAPKAIFLRYRALILSVLGALVLALLYIVSVRRIVRIRTHALRVALREKDAAQERDRRSREQLFALEKAGVVSGLSAMFAHEVRQPIASLVNYAGGLKMYLSARSGDPLVDEALGEISAQAERVSEIVGRVCSYARNEKSVRVRADLAEAVERAAAVFGKSSPAAGVRLENEARGPAPCLMDPLEVELVLVNLLRNAGAAAKAGPDPAVRMTLSRQDGFWVACVEDSGPYISDEAMKRLAQPVRSEKKEGLGLGLTICRIIAEEHGGHLSFERREPHGLRAMLHLPVPEDNGEKEDKAS